MASFFKFICALSLSVCSTIANANANANPDLIGAWSVTYNDSQGSHKAYVVFRQGTHRIAANGILLDGKQTSYNLYSSLDTRGGRFKATMSQGHNTLALDMAIGDGEMRGQWQVFSRDDDGRSKARDGEREYESKTSPWYHARGTEHWQKISPKISKVSVTALENYALDHPRMKQVWEAGGVMGNLPQIGIDLKGEFLPILLANLDHVRVQSEDPKLRFKYLQKHGDSDARLKFWLMHGATPGKKKITLNGVEFTADLKFKDYDDSKDFTINKLVIDDLPWHQQQQKLRDQIAEIDRKINLLGGEVSAYQSLVKMEDDGLLQARIKIYELGKKVDKQLKALRKQFPKADQYRTLLQAYSDKKKQIDQLENQIINNDEKASQLETERKNVAATKVRDANKPLFTELETAKRTYQNYEQQLQPYLAPVKAIDEKIKAVVIQHEDTLKHLNRIRDRHRDNLKGLQQKFDAVNAKVENQQITKQKLEDKLAQFALEGTPFIQWVRVSDSKNTTLFFARNQGNPMDDIRKLDPVIEQAKTVRDQLKGTYQQAFASFETDFENCRYYLGELGGPTGAIMRNAYLQAGSESLFYLWDIAEAASKGGPAGALTELSVKTILAYNGKTLTINEVDENKLRDAIEKQYSPQEPGWTQGSFMDDVRTRGLTEAMYVTVRDPANRFIAKLGAHSVSRDSGAFNQLLQGIGKELDNLAGLSKVLDDGNTRLGNLRDSSFSMTDALKSFGKDRANTLIKEFAMSIESDAWNKYFKSDIAARGSYKIFFAARNAYWQADDVYQELLRSRTKLVELHQDYDYASGMTVLHRTPFTRDDALKISISAERENLFKETVALNQLPAKTKDAHHHTFAVKPVADKLNKDVTLNVNIAKR